MADPEQADYWRDGQAFVLYEDVDSSSQTADQRLAGGEGGAGPLPPESLPSERDEIRPAEYYARDELTLAELAEALRPMIPGADGKTYVGKNANWDLARKVRAMRRDAEIQMEGEEPLGIPENELTYIFGSDSRAVAPNQTPYKWMVHFSNNCSGVYIGWHTIITAAHCVYDASNNSWKLPITVTPMKQGSNAPYGTHPLGYNITIPTGYDAGSSGDLKWDFAVVDLTGIATSPTGWNGFIVNYTGSSQRLYGYPKSGTSGATVKLCPGKTSSGWLCGMSGTGYINDFRFESDNMDMSAGQSGGPWMSGSNYTVGVVTNERRYWDTGRCGFDWCLRNAGRRLDSVFWSSIEAWSSDW